MSGTNAAALKKRLVGTSNVLAGLTGMENVKVLYDLPRQDIPREVVYGGSVGGPVELSAMKAGGRIKRLERLNLMLIVRVYQPGHRTREDTDIRATAISALIENYIAATPLLGGLTGLKLASVESVELDGFVEDDGATSEVLLQIGAQSYLT